MRCVKAVLCISVQNVRKWLTDYRVWVIAALLFFVCVDNASLLQKIAQVYGIKTTLWIYPFLYMSFHTKVIVTLPLLLLMCSAPFADENNLYIVTRAGHTKWICGQLLYIALASALYYLFLFVSSVIASLPYADISPDWGNLLWTIAYNSSTTSAIIENNFVSVSTRVLSCFTPISACWFTFLLSWLDGIMLGLIICAGNVIFHKKYVGCGIAGFLVVLSGFVEQEGSGWYKFIRFSPVSWITLNRVDVGGATEYPSFCFCIAVYLSAILLLSILIIMYVRKNLSKNEVLW